MSTFEPGVTIEEIDVSQSETVRKWAQARAYGFALGEYKYLAPVGLYCELVSGFQLSILPNSPKHFHGLMPVRGNLIPVYQLHELMHLPAPSGKYAFVIGNMDRAAALMLDEKPVTVNFNDFDKVDAKLPDAPPFLQESIIGQYQNAEQADDVWQAFDHIKLFKNLSRLT